MLYLHVQAILELILCVLNDAFEADNWDCKRSITDTIFSGISASSSLWCLIFPLINAQNLLNWIEFWWIWGDRHIYSLCFIPWTLPLFSWKYVYNSMIRVIWEHLAMLETQYAALGTKFIIQLGTKGFSTNGKHSTLPIRVYKWFYKLK